MADAAQLRQTMETEFGARIFDIVAMVNERNNMGHIPPVTTTFENPFPFRIVQIEPTSDAGAARAEDDAWAMFRKFV